MLTLSNHIIGITTGTSLRFDRATGRLELRSSNGGAISIDGRSHMTLLIADHDISLDLFMGMCNLIATILSLVFVLDGGSRYHWSGHFAEDPQVVAMRQRIHAPIVADPTSTT
ncbi:MAG: hypothetical protein UU62_C0031G0009 [Candidatus Uhrbacteria bacterium GW2011_GWF2_41_40]|nr:MAG: hypothetical protein UU62_C0031G0009 [Candidatus Uhrbacteria bacterium GW2011_GWF2_41_40]